MWYPPQHAGTWTFRHIHTIHTEASMHASTHCAVLSEVWESRARRSRAMGRPTGLSFLICKASKGTWHH